MSKLIDNSAGWYYPCLVNLPILYAVRFALPRGCLPLNACFFVLYIQHIYIHIQEFSSAPQSLLYKLQIKLQTHIHNNLSRIFLCLHLINFFKGEESSIPRVVFISLPIPPYPEIVTQTLYYLGQPLDSKTRRRRSFTFLLLEFFSIKLNF